MAPTFPGPAASPPPGRRRRDPDDADRASDAPHNRPWWQQDGPAAESAASPSHGPGAPPSGGGRRRRPSPEEPVRAASSWSDGPQEAGVRSGSGSPGRGREDSASERRVSDAPVAHAPRSGEAWPPPRTPAPGTQPVAPLRPVNAAAPAAPPVAPVAPPVAPVAGSPPGERPVPASPQSPHRAPGSAPDRPVEWAPGAAPLTGQPWHGQPSHEPSGTRPYGRRDPGELVDSWVDVSPPAPREPPPTAGTARRFSAGILLLIGGLAGVLPLALPFGSGRWTGWAAITYFAGAGDDLPSAVGTGLVAAAGLVASCLGILVLLPRIGDQVRGRVVGTIALGCALSGIAPAVWFAAASDFALGGMTIGTYAFLLSGLIGLTGAFAAWSARRRAVRPQVTSPRDADFGGHAPGRGSGWGRDAPT